LWIVVAIAGILLLLLGVVVIGSVLRRSLVPRAAPTPLPPATRSVVVARQDLPLGALLRPDDLLLAEVPVELVPPRGALDQIEAAAGRLTRYPLVAGELVLTHHLADPTNVTRDLPLVIGQDQVLMAFPATDLLTQLNLVQRGDLVDVLVTISQSVAPEGGVVAAPGEEEETEEKLFTFDALQRVEISAVVVDIISEGRGAAAPIPAGDTLNDEGTPVPAAAPTPAPAEIQTRAILLALAPQDALVLKHLKDAGGIVDLVLRAPDSTQLFELDPVMSEYLVDRYELESPR
jgi:pilus assembly protein CpaB